MESPNFLEIISNRSESCPLCSDGNLGRDFAERLNHAKWHGYKEDEKIETGEVDGTTGEKIIKVTLSRKALAECHVDGAS
jgi:hypothetical protein